MAVRHSYNAGLGLPAIGPDYDSDMGIAVGTITQGYDEDTELSAQYVWTNTVGVYSWELVV